MPTDDSKFLRSLEAEVDAELGLARSSRPEEAVSVSPGDWQFDPTDVEREEAGLRSLLGAVEALESDSDPDAALGVDRTTRGAETTEATLSQRRELSGPS